MNKIWLIIKREYRSRVRNKTFLLSTFLLPIVFVVFIGVATYLNIKGKDTHKIAVVDPSGELKGILKGDDDLVIEFPAGVDSTNYEKKGYTDLMVMKPWNGKDTLEYDIKSPKQLGSSAKSDIKKKVRQALENKILLSNGIEMSKLDSIRDAIPEGIMHEKTGDVNKTEDTNSSLSSVIGFASGFLIYIMMFIYGAAVMRGVMEEKTNRIAEVIVSSVKPFQLMMGKIIGIGAVGLTQFLLWFILILGLGILAQMILPHEAMHQVQQMQQNNPMAGNSSRMNEMAEQFANLKTTMSVVSWPKIIGCFIFYFLGGYLFYAALFASVGCMVNEDPQEAQSLMLPITMPIVFGFIIMQSAIQNPNSSLAFWGSIIPFTSPIVMMARIASNPPWWQLLLSMTILILGFLFTGWMAGKIYRIGILMYGKKGNWGQMLKWVFTKG